MKISEWSCVEVKQWLATEGFGKLSIELCDKHEVDGEVLLSLSERDLKEPPLQLKRLSDIKKLGKSLKTIQQKHVIEQRNSDNNNENLFFNNSSRYAEHDFTRSGTILSNNLLLEEFSTDSNTSHVSLDGNLNGSKRREFVNFEPEYKKLAVSFLYAVIVSWITAYTMVIVHERVPDKQKHPPLPDIFLDNIPLIPYAFKLTECCGLVLSFMFFTIIFFHKHRAIVMRRFFSIASTIFLLRSVTMFVTSLSVPGSHLNCHAQFNSPWQRITRATEIVTGFGMSLTGLQTCGDYMFSGHTAYLTLFNHLITEYTPPWLYGIHTISWVLNLFGVFFILAAHEHYSIDVLIAFYITSRIFLYYHVLANTRSFWQNKMIKFWFPMMSYFECNVPGKVPNEYEWPLQHLSFNSIKNTIFQKFKIA